MGYLVAPNHYLRSLKTLINGLKFKTLLKIVVFTLSERGSAIILLPSCPRSKFHAASFSRQLSDLLTNH